MPAHSTVRIFDANSIDRREYYSTDLREALKILGRDLRVLSINDGECEKAGPAGDAGLDLVAVVDFDDGASTAYAVLAQCGAQEKGWPRKTLEAHSMRYRNYFQMQYDYPGVMFTPVCFRGSDGVWSDNQGANGVLLADRGRILKLIALGDRWAEIVEADWFIAFENEFTEFSLED
jgi:hypothetical protein